MTMPRTNTGRVLLAIWLAATFVLLVWVFSPLPADAHPDVEVTMCQAEDEWGEYTFPVGELQELFELCNDPAIDGTLVTVDDPGPDEMIRLMLEFGLYNPYWLLEELFFEDTELEESPAP